MRPVNSRLVRVAFAVATVLIASIVVGAALTYSGAMLHLWLTSVTSPTITLICVIVSALIVGALLLVIGQVTLRRTLNSPVKQLSTTSPVEQMIAEAVVRLTGGGPIKLIATSVSLGFVLGVSPRLRGAVYRILCE